MEEGKNWKKAELQGRIDENNQNIKISSALSALLLGIGLATPIIEQLAGATPDVASIYEKFIIADMAITYPLFARKIFLLLKENKYIRKLIEEQERKASEEENNKGMTM